MKVMQRGIMKILPGKMTEAMELNKKHMEISRRYGFSTTMRTYRPFVGGGDAMHTVVFEVEWDSLEELAAFFTKVMADPEMLAIMPKWEAILENHEVEIYSSMEQKRSQVD